MRTGIDMKHRLGSRLRRMIRPIAAHRARNFERRLQRETGLVPIGQSRPEDIFIVGYPKSGNTWMQHLVAAIVFGLDMRATPPALVQDLVPDIHAVAYYRRYGPIAFFKTHDLPQPRFRRVVYLVRDGRDVMVSYFHHLAAFGDAPDLLNMVTDGTGLFPCRWHEHVERWMANPYNADMVTISYEALRVEPVGELSRLCAFAGLQRDTACLKAVAHACSFARMQEREQALGWGDRDSWPKERAFVRRGMVGSFKDEMPQATLLAFTRLSQSALELAGYGE